MATTDAVVCYRESELGERRSNSTTVQGRTMTRYAINNQDEHCSAPAEEEHIARRHAQFICNRSVASLASPHPSSYIPLDHGFIAVEHISLFKHLVATVNTVTAETPLPRFGAKYHNAASVDKSVTHGDPSWQQNTVCWYESELVLFWLICPDKCG